jgi:hypothetical protein
LLNAIHHHLHQSHRLAHLTTLNCEGAGFLLVMAVVSRHAGGIPMVAADGGGGGSGVSRSGSLRLR